MLSIDDVDDLTLLQRALAAARFASREASVLRGSPKLAALHDRVVDALVDAEGDVGSGRSENWRRWRQLSVNPAHFEAIVLHVHEIEGFDRLTDAEQEQYLRTCVLPFVASDEEIEELFTACRARPK